MNGRVMAFNNLWPLAFLVAIPIIIILYIFRPKGRDEEVSSNILWKNVFRMSRSKTVFEKFLHEILMYLEIVAALLLVLGLMSPYLKKGNALGGNVILIIDNSLSMQHKDKNGRTRLELAKDSAMEYADSMNGNVTVVSCSDRADVLLANSTEKGKVKSAIAAVEPTDKEGELSEAESIIATFEADNIVVFSDGNGAEGADMLHMAHGAEEKFFGNETCNISVDFVSVQNKDSLFDVSVRFTSFSSENATLDVTLLDDSDKVLGLISKSVDAGKSGSVIFEGIESDTKYVKARISNIKYSGGADDSLDIDNEGFAVRSRSGNMSGILIGEGNIFVEKAYRAVTGNDIVKSKNGGGISSGDFEFAIFDMGTEPDKPDTDCLILGAEKNKNDSLSNVVIDVSECTLTEGLGSFKIGANKANTFDVPEGCTEFMKAGGKCVGYYGDIDGIKCIVLGFDIRETNFPVQAEFPVFMAHSMKYLSEQGLLIQNEYIAGEPVRISPGSGIDLSKNTFSTDKAGIYEIEAGEAEEYYAVSPDPSGFDGRKTAKDVAGTGSSTGSVARKNLRRVVLILAVILLILEFLIFAKKMRYKGLFYSLLRIVIVLLVILSLIELHIPKRSRNITTIFLVDMSKSNESNLEEIESVLRENLMKMPKHNSYGIVTFGRNSVIDQFITDENVFMGLDTVPDISATNFEDALTRALTLIPADSNGRIVILSDGRETAGDIEAASAMVQASNVSIEAIKYEAKTGKDTFIKDVDMPSVLHPGDKYYMNVSVESNYETDAEIVISSGDKVKSREKVHLAKGDNSFVFEENVSAEDIESFSVSVTAPGDTVAENDAFSAYAEVEMSPKILVLYGSREDYTPFKTLLSNVNANVDIKRASDAPKDLMGMLEYKTIILENAYISELPEEFAQNVKTYVKDYGCGFGMLGGEDSFMLGGYNDTDIEEVLPEDMELRGTAEIPTTAIVMVIDHSGSMSMESGGYTYLDIAVESAKRGADNLRNTDYLGVIAFDDRFEWYVDLEKAADKEKIKEKIDNIKEGGGTTIQPAVKEAYRALSNCDAEIKHIILLTDGYGESNDYRDIVKNMKSAGITLSTVAVGEDSDQTLMKSLATQCNGRYYYADGNVDLPRIFASEVFLGGDTYIKNGEYPIGTVSTHDITKNIFTDGWKTLGGYNAASGKQGSTMLLSTEDGDPILTIWQYGLGRTFAWNSDVDNGWTAGYAGDSDYAELWKRILDYASGSPSIGDDKVEVKSKNGKTTITYTTGEYSDGTEISAIYTAPDKTNGEIKLTAVKPGVYTAEIPSESIGIYHINVRREDDGTVSGSFTTASAVQYSDEYRFDVTDEAFTRFIDSNGMWIKAGDDVWKKLDNGVRGSYNLTDILLILAIILFLLDIAGRRLGIEPSFAGWARRRLKDRAERETATNAAGSGASAAGSGYAAGSGGYAAGSGASAAGSGYAAGSSINAGSAYAENKGKKGKNKKTGKAPSTPVGPGLDTAALLQKKRDRNL